jgi:hypothetical protein
MNTPTIDENVAEQRRRALARFGVPTHISGHQFEWEMPSAHEHYPSLHALIDASKPMIEYTIPCTRLNPALATALRHVFPKGDVCYTCAFDAPKLRAQLPTHSGNVALFAMVAALAHNKDVESSTLDDDVSMFARVRRAHRHYFGQRWEKFDQHVELVASFVQLANHHQLANG